MKMNLKSKIFEKVGLSIMIMLFSFSFFTIFNTPKSYAQECPNDPAFTGPLPEGCIGIGGSKNPVIPIAKFDNPIGINDLEKFIAKILEIAIKIGIPVCVFFMVYAGFLFVSARGNEEAITKAKKTFLYTVIGVALLLGSWALAKAIQGTVNQIAFNIINNINLLL